MPAGRRWAVQERYRRSVRKARYHLALHRLHLKLKSRV